MQICLFVPKSNCTARTLSLTLILFWLHLQTAKLIPWSIGCSFWIVPDCHAKNLENQKSELSVVLVTLPTRKFVKYIRSWPHYNFFPELRFEFFWFEICSWKVYLTSVTIISRPVWLYKEITFSEWAEAQLQIALTSFLL